MLEVLRLIYPCTGQLKLFPEEIEEGYRLRVREDGDDDDPATGYS